MAALAHPAGGTSEAGANPDNRRHLAVLLTLFAGAAIISGFTVLRGGAPFDEGLVLQAARRVADGQIPYRDFLWPYGPAQPYVFGASFDLFGTSLLWWRIFRVACDAAVAVTVYSLVRREASPPFAVAGWLVAACAMAQPTSATPFPPALLLGLLAFAVATRTPASRHAPLVAGLLVGAAAAWRLDFGIYAGGAVLVSLLLCPAPFGKRAKQATVFAATASGATVLAYLPFLVAVGPADLYEALVGSSLRERDFWTLPFPLVYEGEFRGWPPGALLADLKDVVGFYLPALAVLGLGLALVAAVIRVHREPSLVWRPAGVFVLAVGGLLYLLSRTDEFHITPLIVMLAVALPLGLASRVARPLHFALAACLALVAIHGGANRLSALVQPPPLESVDVPVADGTRAPPGEARALERMVAIVQREVPPGEPIYAITRRSDLVRFNQPLIYVLTERENPTDRDFGLQTSEEEQRRTVERLRASRPRAIVRWTDPISTFREPNLRGRPSGSRVLDEYVATDYRLLERAGEYEVLVPLSGGDVRSGGAADHADR